MSDSQPNERKATNSFRHKTVLKYNLDISDHKVITLINQKHSLNIYLNKRLH